jgi:alpha-beta hydrolase superfamily lysophospholipase
MGPKPAALYVEHWPAASPRALLVIVHGVGEHVGRYAEGARSLAARGIECVGHDHRGHGRSPGQRGHVERFEIYIEDLAGLVDRERAQNPELPVFLLGHSMGALIALYFAETYADVLAGVIVTGTPLQPTGAPSWLARLVGKVAKVAPRLPLPSSISPAALSHDEKVQKSYASDVLVDRVVSARWVGEFEDARAAVLERAPSLETPLLLIHGGDDEIARPAGARALFESAGSLDKRLDVLTGQRHEVLNETLAHRQATWRDIAATRGAQ